MALKIPLKISDMPMDANWSRLDVFRNAVLVGLSSHRIWMCLKAGSSGSILEIQSASEVA